MKAMELDERPTEEYSDIGGLDKQIEEVRLAWGYCGVLLLHVVCAHRLVSKKVVTGYMYSCTPIT